MRARSSKLNKNLENKVSLFIISFLFFSFSQDGISGQSARDSKVKLQQMYRTYSIELKNKEEIRHTNLSFIHDLTQKRAKQLLELRNLKNLRIYLNGPGYGPQRNNLRNEILKIKNEIREIDQNLTDAHRQLTKIDHEIDKLESKSSDIKKELKRLEKSSPKRPSISCAANKASPTFGSDQVLAATTAEKLWEHFLLSENRTQKEINKLTAKQFNTLARLTHLPEDLQVLMFKRLDALDRDQPTEKRVKPFEREYIGSDMIRGRPRKFNSKFNIQNVAGDGNCFFTSFLVAVLNDKNLSDKLLKKIEEHSQRERPNTLRKAQAEKAVNILKRLNTYSSKDKIKELDREDLALPLIQVLRNMIFRYAQNNPNQEVLGLKIKYLVETDPHFERHSTQLGEFAELPIIPLIALATETSVSVYDTFSANGTIGTYSGSPRSKGPQTADVNVYLSDLHYQALLPVSK